MALKDVPDQFDLDSEDDLKLAVAQYFSELGFDQSELSMEDQFAVTLGHNTLVVIRQNSEQRNRAGGRSDILLTRRGEPLAIVETKALGHPLGDEDALQAISYARLLRTMAPYAIVTNGRETRVYDTLQSDLTELVDPVDSPWAKNGNKIPSIGEDLRAIASQVLVGINADTLHGFCEQQVDQALADLKGSLIESKAYVPQIYYPRQQLETVFSEWLSTDFPCFAVIGESGFGKTNFMCATAETLTEQAFVFFYRATRLTNGLLGALRNDFEWEFHRERGIPYIIERFTEIAGRHSRNIVIFIDGLDEFPGDRNVLKNELIDLVHRLKGGPIKVCVSCKLFDWGDFVIDAQGNYNQLAKAIYPARTEDRDPRDFGSPDAKQVGVLVTEFSDGELDVAFAKYKHEFSLQGELRGRIRTECHDPLMLRLVAEAYRELNADLPAQISSRQVFDLYWQKRLRQIVPRRRRIAAEQVLTELARLSVQSGQRQVAVSTLMDEVGWTDLMGEAYEDLVRFRLVQESEEGPGILKVTFALERLRSYTYTVRTQQWPAQEPAKTAEDLSRALANPLGLEAVEFYLTTIDRGEAK